MIDIEDEVFATVKNALSGHSAMSAEYETKNTTFPLTTMKEIDNTPYEKTQDSASSENHISWACQFDIYSNLVSGKKTQCKNIRKIIDETMTGMGFVRMSTVPVDNFNNATIFRMPVRYRGIVGTDKSVYRR